MQLIVFVDCRMAGKDCGFESIRSWNAVLATVPQVRVANQPTSKQRPLASGMCCNSTTINPSQLNTAGCGLLEVG